MFFTPFLLNIKYIFLKMLLDPSHPLLQQIGFVHCVRLLWIFLRKAHTFFTCFLHVVHLELVQ
jgi:hypothetical protein